MTEEKQRIAIAEACGWKRHADGLGYYQGVHPAFMGGRAVPDYLNDLNAMHEAEKVLTDEQWEHYRAILYTLTPKSFALPDCERSNIHANAAQRAEAFLKTLGLWEQRDEAREDAERWKSSSDAMERAGAEQARRADENREWALKAERELTTVTEQRDRLAEALNLYAWKCNDEQLAHHCASSCKPIALDANRERKRRKAINYFLQTEGK